MTDPSYDEDNLREDIALPDETDDGDVKETNANIILFSGGSLKHAFSGATVSQSRKHGLPCTPKSKNNCK